MGIYGNPSAVGIATEIDNANTRHLLMPSFDSNSHPRYGDLGSRRLQDVKACVCNAQAVADRPPSEAEFILAFRESVESLQIGCVASVGECQFGSTFDTDIVLSFQGNQTSLTPEVQRAIQQSFLALLNDLYEPNEEVCNPEFRVILDVEVLFEFTLNGEFIESSSNATSAADPGVRHLQDGEVQRFNQEDGANGTNIPSTSRNPSLPLESLSPTITNMDPPTASPTLNTEGNTIRTLLTVSGVCNGCANELFLSNNILGGRTLRDANRDDYRLEYLVDRELNGVGSDTYSRCFCPLTAIVNLSPPAAEEIQGELSLRLEEEEVDLVVKDIDTVSAISFDDETETTEFTSEFTFAFSAFDTIPDLEIQELGTIIARVYNDLIEEFCDPLIRREIVLELKDRERAIASGLVNSARRILQEGEEVATTDDVERELNCVNFEAIFSVQGLCRGCDNGTPLLHPGGTSRARSLDVHNRILSSGARSRRTRRRHLENDPEECFCDMNTIAPRAPILDELWLRLEAELGSLVEVCGRPVECEPATFVSEFSETTILAVQIERGRLVTESDLLELEVAYLTGYNEMQSKLRVDKCGGNFRQINSLTADRGILGTLRHLQETGGGNTGPNLSVYSFFLDGIGGCPRKCRTKGRDEDVIEAMLDSIRAVDFVYDVVAVNEYLTGAPTTSPSSHPSTKPSVGPSASPSTSPSVEPSFAPSMAPSTLPSTAPSMMPSVAPSESPSISPSASPSGAPSISPSTAPSSSPSETPSLSSSPSDSPSWNPSLSVFPSITPSLQPTSTPSYSPTGGPSSIPSDAPTVVSSTSPSGSPSHNPSRQPTSQPSLSPSASLEPSASPTIGCPADVQVIYNPITAIPEGGLLANKDFSFSSAAVSDQINWCFPPLNVMFFEYPPQTDKYDCLYVNPLVTLVAYTFEASGGDLTACSSWNCDRLEQIEAGSQYKRLLSSVASHHFIGVSIIGGEGTALGEIFFDACSLCPQSLTKLPNPDSPGGVDAQVTYSPIDFPSRLHTEPPPVSGQAMFFEYLPAGGFYCFRIFSATSSGVVYAYEGDAGSECGTWTQVATTTYADGDEQYLNLGTADQQYFIAIETTGSVIDSAYFDVCGTCPESSLLLQILNPSTSGGFTTENVAFGYAPNPFPMDLSLSSCISAPKPREAMFFFYPAQTLGYDCLHVFKSSGSGGNVYVLNGDPNGDCADWDCAAMATFLAWEELVLTVANAKTGNVIVAITVEDGGDLQSLYFDTCPCLLDDEEAVVVFNPDMAGSSLNAGFTEFVYSPVGLDFLGCTFNPPTQAMLFSYSGNNFDCLHFLATDGGDWRYFIFEATISNTECSFQSCVDSRYHSDTRSVYSNSPLDPSKDYIFVVGNDGGAAGTTIEEVFVDDCSSGCINHEDIVRIRNPDNDPNGESTAATTFSFDSNVINSFPSGLTFCAPPPTAARFFYYPYSTQYDCLVFESFSAAGDLYIFQTGNVFGQCSSYSCATRRTYVAGGGVNIFLPLVGTTDYVVAVAPQNPTSFRLLVTLDSACTG